MKTRLFQPLLFFFAKCTRNELIRQIEFLRAENELLRKRVPRKQIHLNPEEKARLMKLGNVIGTGLRHLITIVTYQTYRRWVRATKTEKGPKKKGRPRTPESV
ncbi:MAG: hypothetical protein ACE5KM_19895 [Planctomycetaceae bacterium]